MALSVVVVVAPAAIGNTNVENVPEVPEMVPDAATFVGEMVEGKPSVAIPF